MFIIIVLGYCVWHGSLYGLEPPSDLLESTIKHQ